MVVQQGTMKPSGKSAGRGSKDLVSVGRIGKATGLKGELNLHPYLEVDGLSAISRFFVQTRDGHTTELKMAYLRHKGKDTLVVKFFGIESPEKAREIAGLHLLARAEDLPATAEGEIYAFELVGMSVLGPGGEFLGKVEDLTQTPSYFILELDRLSIPLTGEFVSEIDRNKGILKLKRF
ncbi:MAG: ribosome maturation factor RimM [candidate division WOR-3 bacterium]